MRHNPLLVTILSVITVYWGISTFAPGWFPARLASLGLLVFGSLTLLRYSHETWSIVFRGSRDSGGSNAHLSILGTWLVAFGLVYIGLFGLTWAAWGQPISWIDTFVSSFGRFCVAIGLGLIYISPDMIKGTLKLPAASWIALVFTLAILAAAQFGFRMGQYYQLENENALHDR